MAKQTTSSARYTVDFVEPPRLGTTIKYFGGSTAELIEVQPYQRKDGSNSFLLFWQFADGKVGTTGLRSHGMTWVAK